MSKRRKDIARVFAFFAIQTSEDYSVEVAIFAVIQNSPNVQGKHGSAFPSQNLYNTKDNVILKVGFLTDSKGEL